MVKNPVLFLVFNRLDVTKKVFEAIANAKPTKLYIACDGARVNKVGEDKLVNELRDYLLSNVTWDCEVKTLFRGNNLGCGRAVSSAITWFFEHEEQGIILEDDCLPSHSFFQYCEQMLDKYRDDKRIWHIGGYSVLDKCDLVDSSYYFSQMTQIWGWATWRDRWQKFDIDMKLYPKLLESNSLDNVINSLRLRLWHKQLFDDNYGNYKTWDCQWYFTALINNGMSITPAISLVENLGFSMIDSAHPELADKVITNTKANEIQFPLVEPKFMLIDKKLDAKYFKWRTKSGVYLKILASPIRLIDSKIFGGKMLNFYKKLRAGF